jgi:hypothetical protein
MCNFNAKVLKVSFVLLLIVAVFEQNGVSATVLALFISDKGNLRRIFSLHRHFLPVQQA